MQSLSEHDASGLLGFVSELRDVDDPLPFPPRLLAGLRTLIAADHVSYSELCPAEHASIAHVWHSGEGEEGVSGEHHAIPELWWSLRNTHPSCGYRTASGDWTTARKVSDFVTLREFRETPMYQAYYRGFVDHWLDVGLKPDEERTRVFNFTRLAIDDFDERDRTVASLLQPYLAKRAREAEASLQATEALTLIEEGGVEEARSVVLCSSTGVIEFGSASARGLLESYLGIHDARVPAPVLRERELIFRNGARSLYVRIARTGALYVMLLEERDLRLEKLTARERQILEHVVAGKQNVAVALELGIAPATVAKHLERAYRKLGVSNRTAAGWLLSNN